MPGRSVRLSLVILHIVVICIPLMHLGSVRAAEVPLTLVNPYPATGAVDIAGTVIMSKALRTMQNYATPSTTDALVQQLRRLLVAGLEVDVHVLRNPRGGGEAAARSVAATDDLLLLFAGSGLSAGSALDAMAELKPLAVVAQIPLALVIFNDRGSTDLAQLIRQSSHRSQPLQIGTPGERSAGRYLVDQLQQYWPQGLAPVAYNGGNGAVRSVLARQIAVALAPLPAVLPYASNLSIRILTLGAGSRHVLLPGVPTFAEAGLPDATAAGWHGLFVASAMPAAVVTRLQSVLAAALQSDDMRQSWAALGYIAAFGDAAALDHMLKEEGRRASATGAGTVRYQRSDSSGGFTALNIFSNVRS